MTGLDYDFISDDFVAQTEVRGGGESELSEQQLHLKTLLVDVLMPCDPPI